MPARPGWSRVPEALRPLHVLVVEDDPTQVSLVRGVFAGRPGQPFTMEERGDLASSLRRLQAGGVDVVLLDLELPDSRGVDSLARLHAARPDLPIVVVTGHEEEDLGVRAIQMGAQDYLFKGHLNHLLLPRALLQAVERKRMEDELVAARVARPLVRDILQELLSQGGLTPPDLMETGRRLAAKVDLRDVRAVVDAFQRLGLATSLRWDSEGGRHIFTATGLLERKESARSTTCHLTLGFLTGAVSRAHGLPTPAAGTETHCQSRGDEACVFVVRVK
jgi:CheY-like chemotaxis protein